VAKDSFWKHKELLRGNIWSKVKKRILDCFPVLKYSRESWTLNNDLTQRINAFEQWCYRRLLKLKLSDKVSNKEVIQQMKDTELHVLNIALRSRSWLLQDMFFEDLAEVMHCKFLKVNLKINQHKEDRDECG